jgi:hypothetical protein
VQQPGKGIDYMIPHLLSHSDGAGWLKVNPFVMEQIACSGVGMGLPEE